MYLNPLGYGANKKFQCLCSLPYPNEELLGRLWDTFKYSWVLLASVKHGFLAQA